MDFASNLYEINQLDKEIKNLSNMIKKHKERKKTLMNNISNYLLENNKKEMVLSSGKTIKLEEYIRKTRKKEANKKTDVINVIKEHLTDDTNPEELYKEIKKSFQGEEKIEYKLV